MGFLKTCTGNLNELSLLVQLGNGFTAAVAHTASDTADQLEYSLGKRSLEGYTTLNALGKKLIGACLEVSVLRACRHSAQRAHAAVYLEGTALIDFNLAGSFLTACKE